MLKKYKQRSGFTLIELLIVIAIVAILSVVVILVLNPAELLKQARDSTRVSDVGTLKTALALFFTDGQTYSPSALCYITTSTTSSIGGTSCAGTFTSNFTTATTTTTVVVPRGVTGSGWIPVNLAAITTGAPISNLPVDPVNNGVALWYAYGATSSNNGFKIVANMESTRYASTGVSDVEGTDGGTSSTVMESGTLLTL